jgi:hypothetical protein
VTIPRYFLSSFEQPYDPGMATPRDLVIAQLTGVAAAWAGRYRPGFTRDEALAEVRDTSRDPDELAEAAAMYAAPLAGPALDWHADAVQLLVDAGADLAAVDRHAEARRARPRGFSLGQFAEGVNKLDSAHGPTP